MLLRSVVTQLCGLCCEPPGDGDNGGQLPARHMASQALDTLALNLPSTYVFPQARAVLRIAPSAHVSYMHGLCST